MIFIINDQGHQGEGTGKEGKVFPGQQHPAGVTHPAVAAIDVDRPTHEGDVVHRVDEQADEGLNGGSVVKWMSMPMMRVKCWLASCIETTLKMKP